MAKHQLVTYTYCECIDIFRKLDLLQPGIQESFSIAIQTMITFFGLNMLPFYYEWRLALFLMGSWPLGMAGGLLLQLVIY